MSGGGGDAPRDLGGLSVDDRVALEALIVELGWRIDRGHADTAWELFTEEGVMALSARTFSGREELKAWGAERSGPGPTTRHVYTNQRLVASGPGRATGTVTMTVYLHDSEGLGTTVPLTVSDLDDEYVVTPEGWRIVSRRTRALFTRSG